MRTICFPAKLKFLRSISSQNLKTILYHWATMTSSNLCLQQKSKLLTFFFGCRVGKVLCETENLDPMPRSIFLLEPRIRPPYQLGLLCLSILWFGQILCLIRVESSKTKRKIWSLTSEWMRWPWPHPWWTKRRDGWSSHGLAPGEAWAHKTAGCPACITWHDASHETSKHKFQPVFRIQIHADPYRIGILDPDPDLDPYWFERPGSRSRRAKIGGQNE